MKTVLKQYARRVLKKDGLMATRHLGPTEQNPEFNIERRTVRYEGQVLNLHVRSGTIDSALIDMILCEQSMYALHSVVRPEVIFDVGGNIGIASVYFAMRYPNARIYCFEPLPANLELLRMNVAAFGDRMTVLPYGLSDVAGSFEYRLSNNRQSFGGGTFCNIGADASRSLQLPLKTVSQAMKELNLNRVDLFKLDTEGSEYAILQGVPPYVRERAQAFVGELHGVNDWQFCQMLDDTHTLEVDKPLDRSCFAFAAVRRDLFDLATPRRELRIAA